MKPLSSLSAPRPLQGASRQRRQCLQGMAAVLGGAFLPSVALTAQAAQTRRILVGFGAGGGGDLVARLMAERLSQLSTTADHFIVENKPGAAGKLAVDALRSAKADGSTLLLAPLITPVLSQLVFRNPGYDPAKDMKPVGLVAHFQFALAVPANHPVQDIQGFVNWIKANPTLANFGSPSAGSLPHFFGLLLGKAAGVDFVHIAYKGGPAMVNDLIGGQISAGINTVQELLQQHAAGKVRVLGVFSEQRVAQMPSIPTFAESGFPEVRGSGWYSLWTTANTPDHTVQHLNHAVAQVLQAPQVQKLMHEWVLEPQTSTPQGLEELRQSDIAKWRPVLAASGFVAD
jgi:tripartite-type tricarboxylate transporter receptor subunit TctC